jgi:hypothetical protein
MIIESFGDAYQAKIDAITDSTIQLARIVIPLLMFFHLFNAIVKFSAGNSNSVNAWNRIFQVFIMFLLLTGYKEIMWGIDGLMNAAAISLESKEANVYQSIVSMMKTQDDVEGFWASTFGALFSIKQIILSTLMDGVSTVVRLVVELLSLLISTILIIVGPLAIMFECMPYFGEGNLKHWFNSFLSIKCWLITLAVLDRVLTATLDYMNEGISNLDNLTFLTPMGAVVVIFVLLYLMVPVITRYYIQGQGGALATAMVAAGSTAISGLTTIATGGASMAGKLAAGNALRGSK